MNENLSMYSIFDGKAERWDTPFFAENDLFAQRHFYIISCKNGSMLNTFLGEFELYRLGTFNIITSEYTKSHKLIKTGKELKLAIESNEQKEINKCNQ